MKHKVLVLCNGHCVIDDTMRVPKHIEIYTLTSLELAMDLITEIKFDTIFTEMRICKDSMAGYKMMKHAREKSFNDKVSIYAVGLDKVNACRSWAKNIGFDDFYYSPNNEELLKHIKRLFQTRNQKRAG